MPLYYNCLVQNFYKFPVMASLQKSTLCPHSHRARRHSSFLACGWKSGSGLFSLALLIPNTMVWPTVPIFRAYGFIPHSSSLVPFLRSPPSDQNPLSPSRLSSHGTSFLRACPDSVPSTVASLLAAPLPQLRTPTTHLAFLLSHTSKKTPSRAVLFCLTSQDK